MSSEAIYDIEFVEGEFGEPYEILIKNDDGTGADLTLYNAATLYIKTKDFATERFNVAVTIGVSKVIWDMLSTQTGGYNGEQIAQVVLVSGTTKKRKTVLLSVFVHPKLD